MVEPRFTNREITEKFERLEEKLDEHAVVHLKILDQVTYTNGKLRKMTLILTVVSTIVATLFIKDPNSLIKFIFAVV